MNFMDRIGWRFGNESEKQKYSTIERRLSLKLVFKKIEPNVWKPEKEGDMIEGKLIKVEPSIQYSSQIYSLETKTNGHVIVFGTTILDDKMCYVKVGDVIRIVYMGNKPSAKGQPTKMFDVFVDAPETQEAKVNEEEKGE